MWAGRLTGPTRLSPRPLDRHTPGHGRPGGASRCAERGKACTWALGPGRDCPRAPEGVTACDWDMNDRPGGGIELDAPRTVQRRGAGGSSVSQQVSPLPAPSMSPPCALYASSMRPLCALFAPTVRPLCAHYAPSMRPLYAHYVPSMRPLCAHRAPVPRGGLRVHPLRGGAALPSRAPSHGAFAIVSFAICRCEVRLCVCALLV